MKAKYKVGDVVLVKIYGGTIVEKTIQNVEECGDSFLYWVEGQQGVGILEDEGIILRKVK